MTQIGTFEAKNRLTELLTRVEAGEEIAITRRGKVVARLVPPRGGADQTAIQAAVSRIRANRKGRKLGNITLRELVEEGRH